LEQHVLLAKQPIYNRNLSLYGFELLFRNQQKLNAVDVGEDAATSEVLVNYCTSVSNEVEDANHPLFINISESFLLSDVAFPLDKSGVVLELLERIHVTDEVVCAVHKLHQSGYQLALDDYDFDPKWDPLLPYVDYIKVDILGADLNDIAEKKARVKAVKGTRWLAERIEEQAVLDECLAMGFDFFQGYVLARPKEILGNTIRGSSAVTMQIVTLTSDPDADIADIADLVSQDPKLTMQLLKLINSPLFSLNRTISDLRQAITFLGTDILKRWAMMIAFVSNDTAHIESNRIILTRAKCCELYFKHHLKDDQLASSAFLAGLISGANVLLDIEPRIFIKEMQFSEEIQAAIADGVGIIGQTIEHTKQVEFYLTQAFHQVVDLQTEVLGFYSEAQHWAGEVVESLSSI